MADKRMISKAITESDAFKDMNLSCQALYLHLHQNADDDGFVNNAKSICRSIGASDEDLKTLIEKKFWLQFEGGIILEKHWFINNYIRKDRKKETSYPELLSLVTIKDNGAYTWLSNDGQMTVKCQPRIDKNRLDKNSIDKYSKDKYILGEDIETPPKYDGNYKDLWKEILNDK